MLALEHVSKVYETRHGLRRILDDVSFTVERGRNIGILGRNGAGKSTLIRLISGAEHPTSGRIRRRMRVSWPLAFAGAFQTNMTGLDNLKFVSRIYGVDYKPLLPFIEDFTELGVSLREPVMHYSHGMAARLAFALSMAIEFDCFLIDEAMVVGDARFHDRCRYELFVKRRDRAFIMVSHDPNMIREHCEKAVVLHEGRIYGFDTVDQAYDFYQATLAPPAAFAPAPSHDLPAVHLPAVEPPPATPAPEHPPATYIDGRIALPALRIGDMQFTDLTLTLGQVLSGPDGMAPASAAAAYDPSSAQLTIPAVLVGDDRHTNAVITVGTLLSIGGVSGAATYDGTQLFIPRVEMPDGQSHRDVTVTIDKILDVTGGMPLAACAQYDPATRRLLLAAVVFAGNVHTNVAITVADFIAIDGAAATPG
jgi:capsular polysaccharide transport system ATP-binding protein